MKRRVVFYVNNLENRYQNLSGEVRLFCEELEKEYVVVCCDFNSRIDEVSFPFAFDFNSKTCIADGIVLNEKDVVICRSIGSVENKMDEVRGHLSRLSAIGCFVLNDPHAMSYGMTKHYLLFLQGANIPVIPTRIYPSSGNFEGLLALIDIPENNIMKPITGECGNSFYKISDMTAKLFDHKKSLVNGWIVQPLIDGIKNGEYSYIVVDGNITQVVRKMPKEGEYRVNLTWSGGYFPSEIDSRCALIIQKIIDIWPYSLFTMRVDFVYQDNLPLIMEVETVNPGFTFIEEGARFSFQQIIKFLKKNENNI